MYPTTSNVFTNDISASEFRRAVRRQVATRAEYALPGAGASAQEVQQAYLRYLRGRIRELSSENTEQIRELRSENTERGRSTEQAPPPYTATSTEQAPPAYTASSETTTPTERLDTFLYDNIHTPPSPPEYEEVAASSPPNYDDVISLRTTNSSTTQQLSSHNINAVFTGCTTGTPQQTLHNIAIQALNLVVGKDGPTLPACPAKKGLLARMMSQGRGKM
jgi:hypothetical protein